MKTPRDFYPQALVPEHLTKLTIETLPLDRPYYIPPGGVNDYDSPAIYVDNEGRLRMSRATAIDEEDSCDTITPIGVVGVMRSASIDETTGTLREVFVADLRMINSHSLADSKDVSTSITNQEEYMRYVAELENSTIFDGFIAAETDSMDSEDLPRGVFYGDESLHSILKMLDKRSKKLVALTLSSSATDEESAVEINPKRRKKQPKQ